MIKKLWPSLVWALIILLLTGLPGNYFPTVVSFFDWLSPDKIVHLILFGGQSFLLLYGFREDYFSGKNRITLIVLALSIGIFYGFLTEVLQRFVFVGRSGNVYDFIADTIGVIVGFLAFYLLYRKKINRISFSKD